MRISGCQALHASRKTQTGPAAHPARGLHAREYDARHLPGQLLPDDCARQPSEGARAHARPRQQALGPAVLLHQRRELWRGTPTVLQVAAGGAHRARLCVNRSQAAARTQAEDSGQSRTQWLHQRRSFVQAE